MTPGRHWLPVAAAALGLAGAAAATASLFDDAGEALDRSIEERLRAAGSTAPLLLAGRGASPETLRAFMEANRLDGAWISDRGLRILADAAGEAGAPANPLRVDLDRLEAALGGQASVDVAYSLGALEIASGYFPLRGPSGAVEAVLGLEAGEPFSAARRGMARSLAVSLAISLAGALALAGVAASWSRAERGRASLEIEAARGEAAARAAAAAAHEIRHPLAVIRGVVELMKERGRERLGERDQRALDDVLGEVERLRRMAQDFLELSAERVSVEGAVDLEAVLREAARGVEASFPAIRIRCPPGPYPALRGDAGRLRQVLANLLGNAAVAQGVGDVAVAVEVDADGAAVRLRVRDRGPGVAPEVRARLFEPFFTTRANGTGLGLAVSRRIAEAHGGSLQLVEAPGPGATFELRLPIASG